MGAKVYPPQEQIMSNEPFQNIMKCALFCQYFRLSRLLMHKFSLTAFMHLGSVLIVVIGSVVFIGNVLVAVTGFLFGGSLVTSVAISNNPLIECCVNTF
jgi:hypothetical protein